MNTPKERRGKRYEHPSGLSLTVVVRDGRAYVEHAWSPYITDERNAKARWLAFQRRNGAQNSRGGWWWPSSAAARAAVRRWLELEAQKSLRAGARRGAEVARP